MFLLCLLICFALSTYSAQAKVVDSFDECRSFFYQDTEPQGIDQNAKKICQKLENKDFLYATLYSVYHKIPLYSAYLYKYDSEEKPKNNNTSAPSWHLEPQLYSKNKPDHMVLEKDCKMQNEVNQALSSDFKYTGYDRGHLYPNSFQSGDNRKATFTMTNAAPMDACFNRIQWKNWELNLKTFLKKQKISGSVYIVTGTVPSETKISESKNNVSVPSYIWTAVCYKMEQYSSFGYIGKNQPEFNIELMSIPEMNKRLHELYGNSATPVQIFKEDCFGNNQSSEIAQNKFLIQIKLPEFQTKMHETDLNKLFAAMNGNGKINKLTAILEFKSATSYLTATERQKRKYSTSCVLFEKPNKQQKLNSRKREVSESSESFKCLLVPEQSVEKLTAADGSQCKNFKEDSYGCTCVTEKNQNKMCCSTPCLYQDNLKSYQCYSGSKEIKCSPQYSLITINGKRCRDDHPCATYGQDYYWCYTDKKSWEYCSPPLWQSRAKDGNLCRSDYACAKYNKDKPWCYTDDNNWNYCCTADDCFSAVNYKTCKSGHPCGYHGKKYLWCYTTDVSWNYCCKQCTS